MFLLARSNSTQSLIFLSQMLYLKTFYVDVKHRNVICSSNCNLYLALLVQFGLNSHKDFLSMWYDLYSFWNKLDIFLQAENLLLPMLFIWTMVPESITWKLILQITACLKPQTICIREVLKYVSFIYFITHPKRVSLDLCSVSWPDNFYGLVNIQCLSARLA